MNISLKQIEDFWHQVERTLDQLLASQGDTQFEADSLLAAYRLSLQKIDRNLTFHFERESDGGPVEMIFGCDGYPESIHAVLSVVGAAPELSGINFRAFNERYDPVPAFVNMGEELCEIDEFWCSLRELNGKLQLAIYLVDAPKILEMDPRVEAAMILLDALIGEYELMTRVWSLDWYELPIDPVDFGLMPLSHLRHAFDQMKARVAPVGITIH
ncbi:hypothetical protein GCM10011352_29240 [Marinobacterium zhoushanense]|uniref:Uncharacterized protein n=1 Tax=Marinobacterium zhoushanense TaxID=1679163 RepID=A0ABQ1KIC5_9GAMM|nr:hypothetical protein [Marinobacterium zhoushanense]GGC01235.1 hypothetical protein GCM10011352_29240 [Marinobacterium zhoushanense]